MKNMTDEELIAIARRAAIDSTHRYSYMPTTSEAATQWFPHRWVIDALRAVLAQEAGKCEQQDNSALMKVAADLANRHPLRQLYLVCEHQGRINTDSLHEHLDKCGDLLAGIALDIRRAITSPPAPVSVVINEREEFENYYRDRIMGNRTGVRFLRSSSGTYLDREVVEMWSGWQARACLDKVKELNQ